MVGGVGEVKFVVVEPSRLDWVDEEVRGVETRLLVPLVQRGVGCSDGETAVGCSGALRW
jgi:hypothetical protein